MANLRPVHTQTHTRILLHGKHSYLRIPPAPVQYHAPAKWHSFCALRARRARLLFQPIVLSQEKASELIIPQNRHLFSACFSAHSNVREFCHRFKITFLAIGLSCTFKPMTTEFSDLIFSIDGNLNLLLAVRPPVNNRLLTSDNWLWSMEHLSSLSLFSGRH